MVPGLGDASRVQGDQSMKAPLPSSAIAFAMLLTLFGACAKKQDDTQPPATAATGYPQQGYPQG